MQEFQVQNPSKQDQWAVTWVPWCQEWCRIQAPWHHCQCTTWLRNPLASILPSREMACSRGVLLCCTETPSPCSMQCLGHAALQVLEGAGLSPQQPGSVTTVVSGQTKMHRLMVQWFQKQLRDLFVKGIHQLGCKWDDCLRAHRSYF